MNVVQLQDLLRGLPDDRLKQELSQPTGTVPQYLVLSEVVRRDKIREAAASAPQTTVLQDVVGTPTAPQAMPQAPAAYANGGFISPSQAMGNAGFKGFAPSEPKQPMQFGFTQNPSQMFTPNTTPQPPAPVTNTNVNVQAPTIPLPQPQFDGGQHDGPNAPSYYEQPNGYADGGVIALGGGGSPFQITGGGSIAPINDQYVSGYGGGAGGRLGVTLPFMGGDLTAGISGGISGYDLRTDEEKLRDLEAQLSGVDLNYSKDGRDYGVSYSQNPMMDGSVDRSIMFNYSQPFADGGAIKMRDGTFVDRLIGAESGYDPKAKNPLSSAGGLGQFIDSTWLQFLNETQPGLVDRIGKSAALKLKENADLSKDAVDWYKTKNTGVLASAGFEPSEGNLYLAHFLGGKGAKDILAADPKTPAINIVGEKVVKANPFLGNMTAADVINWSNKKIGSSQPEPSIETEPSIKMASMNPADREAGILSGGVMPDPRKRGIMDLFAGDDAKKGLKELGASLFAQGQEQQPLPKLEPLRRGDPSLVKGIVDKTPDQIIAEYRALRQGYMANGGVVKMGDGSPGEPATDEDIRRYILMQRFFQRFGAGLKDKYTAIPRLLGRGADALGIDTLVGAAIGDPSYHFVDPNSAVLMPYTQEFLEKGGAEPITQEMIDAERKKIDAAKPPKEYPSTPVTPWTPPLQFQTEPKNVFDDPNAPKPKSSFDTYLDAFRKQQEDALQLYKDQLEEEKASQAEAGGLPFLLRQLGIGMISRGGNLQQGLQGGLEQAFKAREEQMQAARDKIRELQLRQKTAALEGPADLAKLEYMAALEREKAAAAGQRQPKDYDQYLLKAQEALNTAIKEGAEPEIIDKLRADVRKYEQLAGIPATPSASDFSTSGATVREK